MSTADRPILIVVDGYSSGAQLPAVLAEHGWSCVHVRSLADGLPAYYLAGFSGDAYVDTLVHDGDLGRLVAALRPHRPAAVLPGTESGVVLADRLAAALGVPGNDPATSTARRDKYEMHNRLRVAGLRAMDHFLATDRAELLAWVEAGDWPVVLKPPASAGTDSVTFCHSPAEVTEVFDRLHGTTNQMGGRNDALLAQRFLAGPEYFINGVSGAGRHVITEIWHTEKIPVPGAGQIYDKSVLFDPLDSAMKDTVEYVRGVLDALGVGYGAHHTELIVTDDGPTLVECASRLSGGLHRLAANHAVGASMLDLAARIVADGPGFVADLAEHPRPHAAQLWQVQFISDREGVVAESHYDELLSALRSSTWLQRAPRPGDRVYRTTDLFSSPGIVFMSHVDADVLRADHETVRAWERDGRLFTVR